MRKGEAVEVIGFTPAQVDSIVLAHQCKYPYLDGRNRFFRPKQGTLDSLHLLADPLAGDPCRQRGSRPRACGGGASSSPSSCSFFPCCCCSTTSPPLPAWAPSPRSASPPIPRPVTTPPASGCATPPRGHHSATTTRARRSSRGGTASPTAKPTAATCSGGGGGPHQTVPSSPGSTRYGSWSGTETPTSVCIASPFRSAC
jgi:hypothetical protein